MLRFYVKPRHRSRVFLTVLLFILVSTFLFSARNLSIRHVKHLRLSASRGLVAAASDARRQALRTALRGWTSGTIPPLAISLASTCPPADAAGAAMELPSGRPTVVIDVGANQGHPVTLGALHRRAALVLSVEPDPRNFGKLSNRARKLRAPDGMTRFFGVHGAAGDVGGTKRMLFHRTRNDFSCFTCLDVRKKEVYAADVRIATVDTLLAEAGVKDMDEITLLKTDTQGFELQVLKGARAAFERRKVAAVLVEYDPKLLRQRSNAVDVVDTLVGYGLQCVHLAFSGRKGKTGDAPIFKELPLTRENKERFYDFVVAQGGWTDLFCLRPPA